MVRYNDARGDGDDSEIWLDDAGSVADAGSANTPTL